MTAPRRAWITAIRPVSVIGAAALASVALSVAPWQVVVRAPQDGASSSAPHLVPLRSAALHCPGPETEGLAGVPAVAGGTTTVYAAAAPAAALDQVMVVEGAGLMSVSATSAEQPLAQTSTRGAVVSTALAGPVAGEVAGSGSLAAGLAALQTWTRLDSDDRGLVATPCLAPTSEAWLVAGGGEPTRRERLVIANPGGNAATVDVTVFGVGGAIAAQGSSRLAVPPRGRSVVLLDAIAGGEVSPVVHVVASGGLVTAVIEDSWIDGAVGRGRDDAAPSAPPATDQVIPGVVVDGPGLLRVFVPGTSEAIVQARLLTPAGPTALPTNAVTRVPGGAVRDISLEGVTPGTYAVQLTSDHPIVAAALTHRRPDAAAPSDLGSLDVAHRDARGHAPADRGPQHPRGEFLRWPGGRDGRPRRLRRHDEDDIGARRGRRLNDHRRQRRRIGVASHLSDRCPSGDHSGAGRPSGPARLLRGTAIIGRRRFGGPDPRASALTSSQAKTTVSPRPSGGRGRQAARPGVPRPAQ